MRQLIGWFRASAVARGIASDILLVAIAVADVWLVFPSKAQTYNVVLSFVACAGVLIRRKWPFLAVLVTVPGFVAGWATVASIITLATLAKRRQMHWLTWIGTALVFTGGYVLWPLEDYFELTWRGHFNRAIDGLIYAGGSMAVGLLIAMRQELTARIAQVAASRSREIKLREQTVRAAERARLAREMHDVVSHQVTLIAMQAGALQMSATDEEARKAATTIRELSTHTLEELRNLVGVLRSGTEDETQPGLDELNSLTSEFDMPVTVAMEGVPEHLPARVSQAAYRTVQEALTNVRKHAVGAGASVRVVGGPDTLLVEVRNDRPRMRPSGLPSGGHGLLGLRERTGLLGGTFHAGPTPDGGFRVEATYPLAT
ncbi:sensor histidine kinase [Actinophytocola sp.]|uniref:sensor histidine kinase n=1 Tax=Actinophytocola sp. TaxID=1872138 RepID=UPI0039C89CE5